MTKKRTFEELKAVIFSQNNNSSVGSPLCRSLVLAHPSVAPRVARPKNCRPFWGKMHGVLEGHSGETQALRRSPLAAPTNFLKCSDSRWSSGPSSLPYNWATVFWPSSVEFCPRLRTVCARCLYWRNHTCAVGEGCWEWLLGRTGGVMFWGGWPKVWEGRGGEGCWGGVRSKGRGRGAEGDRGDGEATSRQSVQYRLSLLLLTLSIPCYRTFPLLFCFLYAAVAVDLSEGNAIATSQPLDVLSIGSDGVDKTVSVPIAATFVSVIFAVQPMLIL